MNLGGTLASAYQLNSTLSANIAGLTSNNSTNFAGQGQAYYANITNPVFSKDITISSNNNNLIYLNSANDTYQASIVFSSNNIDQWALGQQTGNSLFYIWNNSLSNYPLQIYLANNLVQIANSLSVGSNNFLLGTASATTNGYSYLPNGLIFQWGQLATLNTTAQFITFPIAFPTSMFSVSGTANGAAFEVTTSNTTGITAISSLANNRLGYWMAIGH